MTQPDSTPLPRDEIEDRFHALMLATFRKVQRIVADRKVEGWSQQQIAARIDMDDGQLSRILSGQSNVTIRTLHRIARAADARLEIEVRPLEHIPVTNRPGAAAEQARWSTESLPVSTGAIGHDRSIYMRLSTGILSGDVRISPSASHKEPSHG